MRVRAFHVGVTGMALGALAVAPPAFAAGSGATEWAPGQLIVAFDRDLDRGERTEAVGAEDASRLRKLPLPGVELVRLDEAAGVAAAVDEFEDRSDVRYAQPDYLAEPAAIPNDPQFGEQWSLHNVGQSVNGQPAGVSDADIDAPEAWDLTTGSPSVVVAVIDTGVAYDHPDLAANVWTNPNEVSGNGVDDDGNGLVDDIRGWDFVDDDSDPYDLHGHGTHVAGDVGAVGNNGANLSGVSQRVSLMPLRIGGVAGSATSSDIIDAMEYAAQNGAAIANVSFNIQGPAFQTLFNLFPQTLYTLSAGNDGQNVDGSNFACNSSAPNVVCVAASTQSDGLAGFSNFGPSSVELAAPGVNNLSTFSRTTVFADGFNDFVAPCGLSAGWTVTPGSWGCENPPPTSSDPDDPALSDSLGGNYGTGNLFATASHEVDLSGQQLCALAFELELHMSNDTSDPKDALRIQEAGDAGFAGATTLQSLAGSTGGVFDGFGYELAGEGDASDFFRFVLDGDGDGVVDDGAYIDNVDLHCRALTTDFEDGTSFSAPTVAGIAALAKAFEPAATAADLRTALIAGVDKKPALSSAVSSGGRANARATIVAANQPPDTQIDSGPAEGEITGPDAVFTFSSEPGASFQCSLDGADYVPCSSPFGGLNLGDGTHTLLVRAIDGLGAADATPASRTFTVTRAKCRGRLPTILAGAGTTSGTPGDDVIVARPRARRIIARGGADRVCGGRRGQVLAGGPGNDTLVARGGNDRLAGGSGRDQLLGGPGRDTLLGGPGRDRCNDGPGRATERSCEA